VRARTIYALRILLVETIPPSRAQTATFDVAAAGVITVAIAIKLTAALRLTHTHWVPLSGISAHGAFGATNVLT